jgi:aerobic carbon-monoxide dehydrogenase medium subunit
MTRKIREFHRPAEVAEAAALLQRDSVTTVPAALGPRVPDVPYAAAEAVVDVRQLGQDYVKQSTDETIHLGAAASIQSLVESTLVQSLADGILAEAAALAGGSAMRNAATVGGTLLYARQAVDGLTRDGPPELLVALMALEAEVVFLAEGQGAVPLAEYLAVGSHVIRTGLLLEVRFPRPAPGAHASLTRVARTPRDQGIVAAAAVVASPAVRLAVAAGGSAPVRLTALEQALSGQPLDAARLNTLEKEVSAAVSPQSDFRASAEYRRAMAGVLARRALAEALRRAGQR